MSAWKEAHREIPVRDGLWIGAGAVGFGLVVYGLSTVTFDFHVTAGTWQMFLDAATVFLGFVISLIGFGAACLAALVAKARREMRRELIVQKIQDQYPPQMDLQKAAKAVIGDCDECDDHHAVRHVYLKPEAFDFTREALLREAEKRAGHRDEYYIYLAEMLNNAKERIHVIH